MDSLTCDARFQRRLLFVNAALPAVFMLWDWWRGNLGANPVEFVTRTTGVLALLFMGFTLLITPLRKIAGWPWLARHRRTLGLFAAFYALAHLLTYLIFDRDLRLSTVPADIWKRPFIAVGMLAFVLLIPLAVTSTQKMIKRLGGRRWTKLHRLTYLVAIAGTVHYWLIVKSDITYPALFAVGFAGLFAWRVRAALVKPAAAASRLSSAGA